MKWELHSYSNLVLFYPFLRAPGNIHSNTKKWRQNQKYGYEQNQLYKNVGLSFESFGTELKFVMTDWRIQCGSAHIGDLTELAKCAG